MNTRILLALSAMVAGASLVSCTPGERGALAGGAIGAGTGAIIGDAEGALIGGAIGAVLGSEISKNRAHRNYGYRDYDGYYDQGPRGHHAKGHGHGSHYGHGYGYQGPPPRRGYGYGY